MICRHLAAQTSRRGRLALSLAAIGGHRHFLSRLPAASGGRRR